MEDLRDYWTEYALRPPDPVHEPLSLQDSSQGWEEGELTSEIIYAPQVELCKWHTGNRSALINAHCMVKKE